jgi:hypothetical protein
LRTFHKFGNLWIGDFSTRADPDLQPLVGIAYFVEILDAIASYLFFSVSVIFSAMNHQDNLSRVNSHLDSILGQGAEILSGE